MCEAVYLKAKYDTPGYNGETRRERNERFEQSEHSPEIEIPENGETLWFYFWELIETGLRINDSSAVPLSHVEIRAWIDNYHIEIQPYEIRILFHMSKYWANGTNEEIEYYNILMKEKADKENNKR